MHQSGENLISTFLCSFTQLSQEVTDYLLIVLDSLTADRDCLVLRLGAPNDLKIRLGYIEDLAIS